MASEADGTPVTEVRSRTRTWRRCRIVLWKRLAGGAALLPRSTNECRQDRHRRPNLRAALVGATCPRVARPTDQASIGTPMTSPGVRCGSCECESSEDSVGVDFDGGASRAFGAGEGWASGWAAIDK